jgi:hypothetical protein
MDEPRQPPPNSSGTAVILAGVVAVGGAAFLFLAALLGPALLQLAGIGLAIVGFVGLHFWLWGCSMPTGQPDDSDPD